MFSRKDSLYLFVFIKSNYLTLIVIGEKVSIINHNKCKTYK